MTGDADVIVVGGGVGGMVAAVRARRRGRTVRLIEARTGLGGLASPVEAGGITFDGGPYILLDRVRLGWALERVGLNLDGVPMIDLDPAYTVEVGRAQRVAIHTDLDRTAGDLDRLDPGAGTRYRDFVERARTTLDRLAPLLTEPHSPRRFLTSGAWPATPWILGSLHQILRRHRVTGPAADAVAIWTHIAGADPRRAPGPMALVPALIHRDGAARPAGGVHRLIAAIEDHVRASGVAVSTGRAVTAIELGDGDRVRGVRLDDGSIVEAETVISDVGGAAALLDLVDVRPPPDLRARMAGPLQSPGLTAYLRIRGERPAEIQFRLGGDHPRARALVHPAETDREGWAPGRLIAPLPADEARRFSEDDQIRFLDQRVEEWRAGPTAPELEIVARRVVPEWGRTFRLRDDAMNLQMARRQMLLGRLPHRIRHLPGLHLTGSWTHPGQWISFCAVSGVLAADAATDDA